MNKEFTINNIISGTRGPDTNAIGTKDISINKYSFNVSGLYFFNKFSTYLTFQI